MSQRYRQERAHNGHIADPTPLNLNNAEYAGEWNGYLDRDNVPEGCITEAMVYTGVFTGVDDDPRTDAIAIDPASAEWQRADFGTGAIINEETVTLSADGVLEIEWSGTWTWAVVGVISNPAAIDSVAVRVTVDGVEVAASGWLSRDHEWEGIHLCGVIPAQAGKRLVQVWFRNACVYRSMANGSLFNVYKQLIDGAVTVRERNLIVLSEIR